MSHYGVNAGVPKTLIQFLIRWATRTDQFDAETDRVLEAILAQEISPELVPGAAAAIDRRTGSGPTRCTISSCTISCARGPRRRRSRSWRGRRGRMPRAGRWPVGVFPKTPRSPTTCRRSCNWLETFLHRFFVTSQFKRSAIPNGPKVSGAAARCSPRGDWRAPSDGTARPWLDELKANGPV